MADPTYSLLDSRLTNTIPPPLTVAPMDVNSTESTAQDENLLAVLQRIGDLQRRPLVPDNPWSQIGSALSAAGSGFLGKPDPVLESYRQERADQLAFLKSQADIASVTETIRARKAKHALDTEELGMKRDRLALDKQKMGLETGKSMIDTGIASGSADLVRSGLMRYREAGVPVDLGSAETLLATGHAKTLNERRDAAIAAIDLGLEPSAVGVNVIGLDVEALKRLKPEERATLVSPDAQSKLAEAASKNVDTMAKNLKTAARIRVGKGQGTALDRRLAELPQATPDQIVGELMTDQMNGVTLNPVQQRLVKQWQVNNELKGLTGNAQLAMRAATGDKDAQKALDLLPASERSLTETQVLMKAAEVQAKRKADPAYQPSTQEQAYTIASDSILERKHSKPLPQYLEKRFQSMTTIQSQINIIRDLMENKGASAYLGPVMGNIHGLLDRITNNEDRAALYGALNVLMAEVGPEKFGGQFTGPEQKIIRAFLAEANNPTKNFNVRLKALEKMIADKHRLSVSVARESKYRLPDEMATLPQYGAPSDPATDTPAKKRARELLLEGKPPAEVKAIMEKEGFK